MQLPCKAACTLYKYLVCDDSHPCCWLQRPHCARLDVTAIYRYVYIGMYGLNYTLPMHEWSSHFSRMNVKFALCAHAWSMWMRLYSRMRMRVRKRETVWACVCMQRVHNLHTHVCACILVGTHVRTRLRVRDRPFLIIIDRFISSLR